MPQSHESSPDEVQRDGKAFLAGPSVDVDDVCRNVHYPFVSLDVYSLKTAPLQRQHLLGQATPVVSVGGNGSPQALWPEKQQDSSVALHFRQRIYP